MNIRHVFFIAFCLFSLIVFVYLGLWQVDRLKWKQLLIQDMEQNSRLDPTPFPTKEKIENDNNFLPLIMSGQYDYSQEIFISAKYNYKELGFHLITPLILSDKTIVLINRGWVPTIKRNEKPGSIFRPSGTVEIKGILRKGDMKKWLVPENIPLEGKWFWTDFAGMLNYTRSLNKNAVVRPVFIQATYEGGNKKYPKTLPGTFHIRNDHLGYAITWFSMALVILVMTFIYIRKEIK